MKKLKNISVAAWFGVSNPFSSAFETLSGTVGKIELVLDFAVGVSTLVAIGMLIYGGYTFIASAGDQEAVDKGSKMISSAVIGLVIVFISRLIVVYVVEKVIF